MTKKLKGDVSETAVLAKLTSLGYAVSIPFGGTTSYDLVVDVRGRLLKIQVKAAYVDSTGVLVSAGPRKTMTNTRVIKYKRYNKDSFDFVVAHYKEDFYIVPIEYYLLYGGTFPLGVNGKQRKLKYDPEFHKNNWSVLESI